MQASRNTRLRYPGGRGALWGIAAYLTGLLATFALLGSRATAVLSRATFTVGPDTISVAELFAADPAPGWTVAGWLLYNAHFVSVSTPIPNGDVVYFNYLVLAGGPAVGLVLLPPALLFAAGVLATRRADGPVHLRFDLGGTAETRYAINGALLAMLGYLPPVLVGWVVFRAPVPFRDLPVTLNLIVAWLVAGILYPVVFGGSGGLAVALLRARDEVDDASPSAA